MEFYILINYQEIIICVRINYQLLKLIVLNFVSLTKNCNLDFQFNSHIACYQVNSSLKIQ